MCSVGLPFEGVDGPSVWGRTGGVLGDGRAAYPATTTGHTTKENGVTSRLLGNMADSTPSRRERPPSQEGENDVCRDGGAQGRLPTIPTRPTGPGRVSDTGATVGGPSSRTSKGGAPRQRPFVGDGSKPSLV